MYIYLNVYALIDNLMLHTTFFEKKNLIVIAHEHV